MKKTTQLFAGLLILTGVLSACSPAGNEGFMRRVETDFRHKQELLPRGDLFGIFDEPMTRQEREAMMFLYAYMPVGDMTDYPGDFYLENVRSALATRREMPWGDIVSDELFRHFVLPVRVNNENLDDSRRVFHDQLAPRVEGLPMYDAILEVNHWCHEKANYQPSDARTSSPLATVRTAHGRCGEESTLLVAALRSVGIPARQVYTPRWAHTDDNHAWVEAWADGRWHFLGACEPEPVLDLGWFNAPASRGMLMHTKVFGYYDGPEEVMKTTANYTEINVISNYAACAPLTVTVTDTAGSPVEGATVEFKLYNYAEFFTVSRKTTDGRGQASLSAGLGDMLVTAVRDGRFGIRKVSFGREPQATVALDHAIGDEFSFPVDIVPPAESANLPEVTAAQRAENDRRFNREDSIRNAYIATFPAQSTVDSFARAIGVKPGQIARFITASRGNHGEIMDFLREASRKGCTGRALQLLATLSEKDLR
ncbi:transglutaminase domain-containing protein, partial [Alistipes shahii]